MDRKGFGLIEILIAVVVVALLAGGSFYLKNLQNQQSMAQTGVNAEKQAQQVVQQINQQSVQEQNILDSTQASTTSPANTYSVYRTLPSHPDTAGWRVYSNAQYDFSFYYPADWFFSTSSADIFLDSPADHQNPLNADEGPAHDITIEFDQNPSNLSFEQYYQSSKNPNGYDFSPQYASTTLLTVGGISAYDVVLPTSFTGASYVAIPRDGYFVLITDFTDSNGEIILNDILSTFQFGTS